MITRTPAQQRAIDSNAPAILCLAGPGSGKSTTLAARIKRLIDDGVKPSEIVAITFTNAGARALQAKLSVAVDHHGERVDDDCETQVDTVEYKLGFSGTLHAFALRMLKRYGAGIGYGERIALIDAEAGADLLQSKATSLGCKVKLDKLLELKAKGRPTGRLDVAQTVVAGYFDELRENGLVDFDTLLTEFARLITQERPALAKYKSNETQGTTFEPIFKFLFVDECQDSSEIDWLIYDALPIANKFFVGDPDQAIYSFRGGRVDCLMRYAKREGVEVIALEDNFRSHEEICNAANRLISHNVDRIAKNTISARGLGGYLHTPFPCMNEGAEIAAVVKTIEDITEFCARDIFLHQEIAVLARTNAICAEYREALKASGIPVAEAPKSTLPRDWALARSLVELLVDPENDTLAFFYLVKRLEGDGIDPGEARKRTHALWLKARSAGTSINQSVWKYSLAGFGIVPAVLREHVISGETQMKVAELVRELPEGSTLVDLALAMNVAEPEPVTDNSGVTVTTFHGCKGLEFDAVFMVGCEDEIIPGSRKSANIEEERRLFYVGATRARKALYIAHAQQRKTAWGAIASHSPSRFISELLS